MRIVRCSWMIMTMLAGCPVGMAGIAESEPNDSIQTANFIGAIDTNAILFVSGSLTSGDVDFFAVGLPAQEIIWGFVLDLDPNVLVGLFTNDGTLLATNQAPIGPFQLIASLPVAGTYYVGLTSIDDPGFIGDHDLEVSYDLVVDAGVFPAPASLALFVVAGFARYRHRSS